MCPLFSIRLLYFLGRQFVSVSVRYLVLRVTADDEADRRFRRRRHHGVPPVAVELYVTKTSAVKYAIDRDAAVTGRHQLTVDGH